MDLRPETPLPLLLEHDYWGAPLHSNRSNKSFRPLTVLSFRLNYALHALEPWGYHLGNLLAHAAVSVLVLALALRLRPDLPRGAVAGALLFAAHPIHTEAVCNTVGRAELLSAGFVLGALLAYDRSAAPPAAQGPSRGSRVAAHGAACLCAVLAALCKETGLLSLVVGAAADLLRQPPFTPLPPPPAPKATPPQRGGRGGAVRLSAAAMTQRESGERWLAWPRRDFWLRTAASALVTLCFLWDAKRRRGKLLT